VENGGEKRGKSSGGSCGEVAWNVWVYRAGQYDIHYDPTRQLRPVIRKKRTMRLPTVIPVALPAPTPSRRDKTIYPQSCVITGEYIAEHDAFISP
jgi:hypothetical protein